MPAASLFVVRNMRRVELLLLPGTVKAALVPPDVLQRLTARLAERAAARDDA